MPERVDRIQFSGRVALYVAFFVWGWYFILLDFRTNDWENILLDLQLIEYDRQIAWVADALGTIFVLTALCWGACIVYLQYQKLSA